MGEWLIMSLPVLIAQTECKSSANSLHLYELLFPLSSLRQEAAIHSASLVYLHYVDPHTILPLLFIKKLTSRSQVYRNRGYFCVLYMCFPMCADERYCSPNVFYRLVPPLRTLKVTPSFPAKDTWA